VVLDDDVGGSVSIGLGLSDVIPYPTGYRVAGESGLDPLYFVDVSQNGAAAADIGHPTQLHPGFAAQLVEFVELPRTVHPFYIATQAHPELRSRPNRAHPLFAGLVEAALQRQQASRLFDIDEA
jgi:CTP synthase